MILRCNMDWYFEDVRVGQVLESANHVFEASEIMSFARAYDPNVFHLDAGAARAIGMPDVIASGFHTLSVSFRLFFEIHPWDNAVLPSPGVDKVRWLRPVCPGDTVFVRATVIETIPSISKPDRGIVRMLQETIDINSNTPVLSAEAMHRLRRRSAVTEI